MQGTLALLIPIISVAGFFGWMLAISPVGKAYAERLRPAGRATEEAGDREALQQALEAVRQDVAELAARGGFAERLLPRARGAERPAPPRPRPPPDPPGRAPRNEPPRPQRPAPPP